MSWVRAWLGEPGGPQLQARAPRVDREVPKLEEEGVVVGGEALLRQSATCAAGQFPGTRWDDHMGPRVGVTGPSTLTDQGGTLEAFR